jgi:hypothetical protein
LPGLTPKSGVPDFGPLKIAKVENIRLWCNPSFSQESFDANKMDPRVKPAGDAAGTVHHRRICSMAGADGKMAVAVSAVLVGGKPVAQALKGLIPKRFTAD